MSFYTLKAGDTKPLRVTLQRSDGTPIPLHGSQVSFRWWSEATGEEMAAAGLTVIRESVYAEPTMITSPDGLLSWTLAGGAAGALIVDQATWDWLLTQPYTWENDTGVLQERRIAPSVDIAFAAAAAGIVLPDDPNVDPVEQVGGVPVLVPAQNRGVVEYHWGPDDTSVRGLFRAAWQIVDAAGDAETVPNEGYLSLRIE